MDLFACAVFIPHRYEIGRAKLLSIVVAAADVSRAENKVISYIAEHIHGLDWGVPELQVLRISQEQINRVMGADEFAMSPMLSTNSPAPLSPQADV